MMTVLFPFLFLLSLALTGMIRRYAVSRDVMDVPNYRSSHTVPTPRGGGIAFLLLILVTVPLFYALDWISEGEVLAIDTGGIIIGALGFMDDHGHVPARWRLLGQTLASIFVLYSLGGMYTISVYSLTLHAGFFLNALAVLYLVWMANLYNFMDGIDGLAAIEAISACFGAILMYSLSGHFALIPLPLMLIVTVAGFLFWNFPPAKIFMGDAGSCFLGLVLAILSIQSGWLNAHFFMGWLILLGVFVIDATLTLFRRLLRGDKFYQAHRTHAYQLAALKYGSHRVVTLTVLGINLAWLMPIAMLVALGYVKESVGLIVAYAPLVAIAFALKAGRKQAVL